MTNHNRNRVVCQQLEYDAELYEDTPTTECVYNVYEMWEGAVFAEYSYCDYDDAHERFDKLVTQAKQCMAAQPQLYYSSSGSTVHLYDTVNNNLIMEKFVAPPEMPEHD